MGTIKAPRRLNPPSPTGITKIHRKPLYKELSAHWQSPANVDVRPTDALCLPRYAAKGEAGDPGADETDDMKDESAWETDGGIV